MFIEPIIGKNIQMRVPYSPKQLIILLIAGGIVWLLSVCMQPPAQRRITVRYEIQDLGEWFAADLNDSGQVLLYSGGRSEDGGGHALIWEKGKLVELGLLPGYKNNWPCSIENNGEVLGLAYNYDLNHGRNFRWRKGKMIDLGSDGGIQDKPSIANASLKRKNRPTPDLGKDFNAADATSEGLVVGWAWSEGGFLLEPTPRAFLSSKRGKEDLNDLIAPNEDWELAHGIAINERGQITGWGYYKGQVHAYLLTPIDRPQTLQRP